jgi:hypothetical protein
MAEIKNQLVTVKEIVSGRYGSLPGRPLSWDERREGIDIVRDDNGKLFRLFSDGGQSTPEPGWKILLRDGDERAGRRWTVYGM